MRGSEVSDPRVVHQNAHSAQRLLGVSHKLSFAPNVPSRCATAKPIPRLAPVTIATIPSSGFPLLISVAPARRQFPSICHLIIRVRTFTQLELGRQICPQGGFTLHASLGFPIIPFRLARYPSGVVTLGDTVYPY